MTDQTPNKLKIILPKTWRGIDTREAYERVLAEADHKENEEKEQTREFSNEQKAKNIRTVINSFLKMKLKIKLH